MKPILPSLAFVLLPGLPLHAAPEQPAWLVASDSRNPYNSPIQRANPNSRQGSTPATPPVRGPTTQPNPHPPTLDNRGIGNGDNLRREQQTPKLEPTRPPRDSQRVP